jgi:hypothetical protein
MGDVLISTRKEGETIDMEMCATNIHSRMSANEYFLF